MQFYDFTEHNYINCIADYYDPYTEDINSYKQEYYCQKILNGGNLKDCKKVVHLPDRFKKVVNS